MNNDVPHVPRLTAQPMPRLGERLAVQQVLFIEIDLREVLTTELHFHPAGGAGGVAAALMVQRKSQFLRGFEQRQVGRHLAASPLRMKKRHPRHTLHSQAANSKQQIANACALAPVRSALATRYCLLAASTFPG